MPVKKNLLLYIIVWIILLALFNVIAFVIPAFPEQDKFTPSFWIGYALITCVLIGHLICTYRALKSNNATELFYKLFYNTYIPLTAISFVTLLISFLTGATFIIFSPLPYWVGAIACAVVLAANIYLVLKASAITTEIERVDKKIATQTQFIKNTSYEAERLICRAQSDEVAAQCRRVYEAIRYSDPMTPKRNVAIESGIASIEYEITAELRAFADAIALNDADLSTEIANKLIALVSDRNQKIKLLK